MHPTHLLPPALLQQLPGRHALAHNHLLQVLKARHGYTGTISGVPDQLLDYVVTRASGNPLFIEQLLEGVAKAKLLGSNPTPQPRPAASGTSQTP